jgi:hypothetical protein
MRDRLGEQVGACRVIVAMSAGCTGTEKPHNRRLTGAEPGGASMSAETNPIDVATAFTKAWTSGKLDEAASYVADDVVFDGPMQKSTGKKPYVEGLSKLAAEISGVRIIAAYGDDSHALLMYGLLTGRYGTLTCAKHLTFRDGKIERDQLAFDSFKIRKATKH